VLKVSCHRLRGLAGPEHVRKGESMTKRFLVLFVLAAGIASSVAIGSAVAGDPSIQAQYSVGCTVLDAFGNGVSTTGIVTVYASGKVTLHCVGQGAGNGSVVFWNFGNTGLSCNVDVYGSTTNWNDRVSKSGESQLWCFTSTGGAPSSGSSGVG